MQMVDWMVVFVAMCVMTVWASPAGGWWTPGRQRRPRLGLARAAAPRR